LGQRRGLKNPWARQEDVFFVHPQNSLNGLILNWCIGGCCFTLASEVLFLANFRNIKKKKRKNSHTKAQSRHIMQIFFKSPHIENMF